MQKQSKIDALYEYFKKCELLKDGVLGVDYLGPNAPEYSINTILNASPVVKQYTDGGQLKQYPFYFQSQESYTEDAADAIANSGFYEEFEAWIKKQDEDGNLPNIEGIQSIEALSNGFLYDAAGDTATYQIQCRILYIE